MKEEQYPNSAISTWSGFVYQGKIALYHCLSLIYEGDLDFDLQLDSTDDFAVYKNGKLISAHQVKAKVGNYRSSYLSALEKAGEIEGDRVKGSSRYIHVSVDVKDTSDFIAVSGEVVKFYAYGSQKYCGLGDIEDLTKELIVKICSQREIILSERVIKTNYCLISEKISSQSIEIHRKNQVGGVSENKAAYIFTINAQDILLDIINNNPDADLEYFALELRQELYEHLESRLDQALPQISEYQYQKAKKLFEHLHDLNSIQLQHLCQLMKPSERFSKIQKIDIRRYSILIESIYKSPIYKGLPHYIDKEHEFYIPTALSLNDKDESDDCIVQIKQEAKRNKDLLYLLYEYENLIAAQAPESFIVETKITEVSDQVPIFMQCY